ncbi:MAG: hypothetical protein WBF13_10115 [Candidatus Zixiibacteriota bacterium]
MNRETHLMSALWLLVAGLLVCSCVGKRPDDDVAMIKRVLATFERGVDQKSEGVIDSVVLDKKQNISSQILDDLDLQREFEGVRIASKSFVIVGDSAEVRLTLSLEYPTDQKKPRQVEKPIKLYLKKKRGKWRIKSFSTARDEGVRDERERENGNAGLKPATTE